MSAQHEKIRQVAYGLWQKAGQPSGKDMDFWLKAETQVQKSSSKPAAKTSAKAGSAKTASSKSSASKSSGAKANSSKKAPAKVAKETKSFKDEKTSKPAAKTTKPSSSKAKAVKTDRVATRQPRQSEKEATPKSVGAVLPTNVEAPRHPNAKA